MSITGCVSSGRRNAAGRPACSDPGGGAVRPRRLTRHQSADLDTQRRAAGQRSRFEQALFRLKAALAPDPDAQPTCFISYAWGKPEDERWVAHELAPDLAKAGITSTTWSLGLLRLFGLDRSTARENRVS